jgi:ABC-type amino acid transport substrate-binding protein
MMDTGKYGHKYGSNEHETKLVATFQGDGVTDYKLQVTGYDIDFADEVSVHLNGVQIGYLSMGPDYGLNVGDVITLPQTLLVAGENTIEFHQQTAGWMWGVTHLAVVTSIIPPPGSPVVALTVDTVDTGQYGHNYGSNEHETRLFATFQGDGVTDYRLQVTGYDIDFADEVSVHLNGVQIGYLSIGPDNGLNAGDVFSLPQELLIGGGNTIELRQRTAGWKWGVTHLAVVTSIIPPPGPPVVALTVDLVDTGKYGHKYGSNEHETQLVASFQGDGVTDYKLQVTGFDIDFADEVSVHLNGVQIGYLSTGPDNGLNAGDVIALPQGLLIAGENKIEFRQQTAGWMWGVTNLAVVTSIIPPPGSPVVALTVDTVDTGKYGHKYGSNKHKTRLFATFQGDGVTDYTLQVTGYDIDFADEISVHLNGVQIGYLSIGPDNGLNAGDVIALPQGLLIAGQNTLEFRQRTAGWKWGVTHLAVVTSIIPPPGPPVIALTVNTVDTGKYGNKYGSNVHETRLVATFQGDGVTDYTLQVTGYDIDFADEISVHLNGMQIGYLSVGPDNGLNAGDVIALPQGLLIAGENKIEFRQWVAGWKWGVTNLGVFDPGG